LAGRNQFSHSLSLMARHRRPAGRNWVGYRKEEICAHL
jgi:hypothetical protein